MSFINKILLKFLFVGLINTVVGSSVMFWLYNIAHVGYWFSTACNYIVGGAVSFVLNKFFTFANHKKSFGQVLLFVLNIIVCYVLAYLLAKRIITSVLSSQSITIKENVSMVCGMCLYTLLNYIGQRYLVFRTGGN